MKHAVVAISFWCGGKIVISNELFKQVKRMASMTPILSREQQRLIKSGTLTEKQIKRMRDSATSWKFEQSAGKDRDGKRIRHTETFHGSKSEAKKALAKFEAYWGSSRVKDRTLGGYIDEYLARKKGTIAESSYYSLTHNMDVVKYMWGAETKLSQITPVLIDDTLDELFTKGGKRKQPCKASYVASIKGALSGLLADAVRHGALVSNPIPLTKQGRYKTRAERREIPPTDALLNVMRNLDVRNYCEMAIMLALTCGLRKQECAALRFSDIDQDVIHVRRSVRVAKGGEYEEEFTKTAAGMRDIPVPPYLPAMLEKRRQTIEEDIAVGMRSGRIKEHPADLYVCANTRGDRPSLPRISHYWAARRRGWGVDCTFHDLRHCFVSCLGQVHTAPATAAMIAGHANPSSVTLDIYSHSSWDQVVLAVEEVSKLFQQGLVTYTPPESRTRQW